MGALTPQINDVLGCGKRDSLRFACECSERCFVESEIYENIVHVGAELPQADGFLLLLTQERFANAPDPIPTTPSLWASRQRHLSMKEIWMRQRNLGELRRLATASRPNICARLAQLAAKGDAL